jgi:multidrug efflux pump subunit AcrB
MGGIVGRLFREFALTLSLAILVSMAISLTTTPMMCALMLRLAPTARNKRRRSLLQIVQDGYARSLTTVLDHSFAVLCTLIATIALNVWLIRQIPKDFFPLQDTGMMIASLVADQSVSFQLLSQKFTQMMSIVEHDPAVQHVVGSAGSGSGGRASQLNTAAIYVSLKPLGQRDGIQVVMGRLRRELGRIPGARLYLIPVQDIRVGGRSSNATYQYTVLGDTTAEVYKWAPKLLFELEKDKTTFTDLNSDQQQNGLETEVTVDRDTASRLGLTMYQIDNTLYDAFGQRSVSTIYQALNQYHVVMEVAPQYWQRPSTLNQIWVSTSGGQPSGSATTQLSAGSVSAGTARGVTVASVAQTPPVTPSLSSAAASAANSGASISNNVVSRSNNVVPLALSAASTSNSTSSAANNAVRTAAQATIASTGNSSASTGSSVATSVENMIPLSAFAKFAPGNTPLAVNHQSQFVAATISFNLMPGKSLSDAQASIQRAVQAINLPSDLIGGLAGTALVFEQSLSNEVLLVVAALAAVYIVLGILYESFIHPLTILSTLPSAGVGAVLALIMFDIPFTIIALIGVILLIGIVKKNAILMIDFALQAEREYKMESREAIFHAAVIRFRPIIMTTTAAMLGALPLCFSFGEGSELRQPLGISIVGGLLVSQVLTLYTTPVVYLYLDRLAQLWRLRRGRAHPGGSSRIAAAG